MEKLEDSLRKEIIERLHNHDLEGYGKRFGNSEYMGLFTDAMSSAAFPSDYNARADFERRFGKLDIKKLISESLNLWDVVNIKEPFKYFLNINDVFPEGISAGDLQEINSNLYNIMLETYGWRDQVVNLLVNKAKTLGLEKALSEEEFHKAIKQIIPTYDTFVRLGIEEADKLEKYVSLLSERFKGSINYEYTEIIKSVYDGVKRFMRQVEVDYLMEEADAIYHKE